MKGVIDSKLAANLVIISGIPAGDSGTGRLVAHLQARVTEIAGNKIRLFSRPECPAPWQIQLWLKNGAYVLAVREMIRYGFLMLSFFRNVSVVLWKPNIRMILLHPQNVGYRLALRLLESRKLPSLIYLLDSSFFCLVSYNHLPGKTGPCLDCLEYGYDQVSKNGCKPFPRPDAVATEFAPCLEKLVKAGRVKVIAQNLRQAQLAQRQFGLPSCPPVIGLWTQDWDDMFSGKVKQTSQESLVEYSWDILFHGYCVDAKGASWTVKVASQCPELRFMFPFAKPKWFDAPTNCYFRPCTWESGLREELAKSRFVIVPSLWSAPIEGALIKSIVCARAVAVVKNHTSYCDELPEGLLLSLSARPEDASIELREAVKRDWHPDIRVKKDWLTDFARNKLNFVPGLLDAALAVH